MGRKNAGFTLVELIIVLAIIAILATIALAYLRGQTFKSNDARRKADLDRIKIAVEEYEKDHDCYPTAPTVVCNPGTGLKPYLEKIPCDPVTNATYYYEYEDSVCPVWFRIYTRLDNPDDIAALPFCGPFNTFNYYVSSTNAPECVPVAGGGTGTGDGGGSSGTSGGGSTPTPPPGGVPSGSYGCYSGVCKSIPWDPARPGPLCDPHFSSRTCNSACVNDQGVPINECTPWR